MNDSSILHLIDESRFSDHRGYFNARLIEPGWIQQNISLSHRGVVRGMHLQLGQSVQAKKVRILQGRVLDVVIDLRPESDTYRKVSGFILSDDNPQSLFVPRGFAHGFISLEDNTIFEYWVDNHYNPDTESSIHWQSPEIYTQFENVMQEYGITPDQILINPKDDQALKLNNWITTYQPQP